MPDAAAESGDRHHWLAISDPFSDERLVKLAGSDRNNIGVPGMYSDLREWLARPLLRVGVHHRCCEEQ
jgi:hypothetical protein